MSEDETLDRMRKFFRDRTEPPEELRLTLGDPCEAPLCPLDATQTVVDRHSKPWRVCDDHRQYFEHPRERPDIGSDVPGGGAA